GAGAQCRLMERSGDDAAGTRAADIIKIAGEPKLGTPVPDNARDDFVALEGPGSALTSYLIGRRLLPVAFDLHRLPFALQLLGIIRGCTFGSRGTRRGRSGRLARRWALIVSRVR